MSAFKINSIPENTEGVRLSSQREITEHSERIERAIRGTLSTLMGTKSTQNALREK